jgi:RNA polymerase sigma-70 factor (ECF subfamily)
MDSKQDLLANAYSRGKECWPDLDVSLDSFRAHVEDRRIDGACATARAADLLLVVAALHGSRGALKHLDELLIRASAAVSKLDGTAAFMDEVRQELRVKLVVGPSPRLKSYAASGALVDWLRVAALRVALNLKRANRLIPTEDPPFDVVLGVTSDEALTDLYAGDLKNALEASFRALTSRERTLLRLHFIEGLNIERIGIMYHVHRATVARWLVAIRRKLFEHAKAQLAGRYGLDSAELKSLYRLLERNVQVTISRLLTT